MLTPTAWTHKVVLAGLPLPHVLLACLQHAVSLLVTHIPAATATFQRAENEAKQAENQGAAIHDNVMPMPTTVVPGRATDTVVAARHNAVRL